MMQCPDCGARLINFTVHGGPPRYRCVAGHLFQPSEPLEPETKQKETLLSRACSALRQLISR